MYCVNCGNKIIGNQKFCTSCGMEIEKKPKDAKTKWLGKRGLIYILLTAILVSLIWFFIYQSYTIATEDEATNVMVALLETIGRQAEAWNKTESIIEVTTTALNDECLYSYSCISEAAQTNTVLRTEIEKERVEIESLWNKGTVLSDFESFYSYLESHNQEKLDRIMNLYFPDEAEEVGQSNQLL